MLFNSFSFLVFFPCVFFCYYSIPHKYRWILLLTASYLFYAWWKPEYLVLIIISTCFDYFAGKYIEKEKTPKKKKMFLWGSISINIGLLFAFKYFNFLNASIHSAFNFFNIPYNIPQLDILLPVGISFYTFQTLSYTIEVYRGRQKAEHHFGRFALYVAFFPQLVAGPIERSYRLLPQLYKKIEFSYYNASYGIKLMAWGFFKKLVIADNIAPVVDTVYGDIYSFNGLFYIIATVLFSYQIYCDFSGYTDIARGAAKVLGFNLMENFKRPYYSKSISEFWKRWHISLSSWFKDYVYIPLGGNRVSKWKLNYNIIITFLLSGIWHGANWTFLLWGGLNGLYLIISNLTKNLRKRILKQLHINQDRTVFKLLQITSTFFLINIAWIFFRANDITDAFYIVFNLGNGVTDFFVTAVPYFLTHFDLLPFKNLLYFMGVDSFSFWTIGCSICILELFHLTERKNDVIDTISKKAVYIKWPVYILFVISILIFGSFNSQEFIYFQF